jgi:hypothetical protein
VIAVAVLLDGTILGIGTGNTLWTRKTLDANWVHITDSGSVIGVTVRTDGTILGIGTDNTLWTRQA